MDSVHYDARLRMTTYNLNNVDAFKYNIGDTLDYTITYTNFGNTTARNITANFPTTPYFKPIGPTTFALDSLGVNDTVRILLRLIFLRKKPIDCCASVLHTYNRMDIQRDIVFKKTQCAC